MFLVSVVLATKFNDDLRLGNQDFGKIGGVSTEELMFMEIRFL